jgi:hypothetical protein
MVTQVVQSNQILFRYKIMDKPQNIEAQIKALDKL